MSVIFGLTNARKGVVMGVGGVSPISGGEFLQPAGGISNEKLIQEFNDHCQQFQNDWSSYSKDPSFLNEKKLQEEFSKILPFLRSNQTQIFRMCQANGWPAGTSAGYETNFEGSCNNLSWMPMPPPKTDLQMLSESLSSLYSMMTGKK